MKPDRETFDVSKLDDVAIATLDSEVELSHALWADEIVEEARWPSMEDFAWADKYHDTKKRFDDYLTGPETRQIGRILFQLKAYEINSVTAMEELIARHNESISRDLEDTEYVRESGINPERLQQARFASKSEQEVLLNAVARFGPGVLHKSAFGRLLVRHANVNRVNASLDTLRLAGFLSVEKGTNNADVIFSDGRLEAAHLASIERIGKAALGGVKDCLEGCSGVVS